MSTLPVSVVIPTFKRTKELLNTLTQIQKCQPSPDEIIIHIDAGDIETEIMLTQLFPDIIIINSQESVGPGGGRNNGIKRAQHNLVASFDDDSFPIDTDYFSELLKTSRQYPDAVVIEAKIYHLNQKINVRERQLFEQYNFTGCGCAYHRDIFFRIGGYVPKPVAYGLEEVDLSLRAFQNNCIIVHNSQLRVFHNTELRHHTSAKVNAGAITNLALLAYLRYPKRLYYRGLIQVVNRILWCIKNRRYNGILRGLIDIPKAKGKYKEYKQVIPYRIISDFFKIRNQKILLSEKITKQN